MGATWSKEVPWWKLQWLAERRDRSHTITKTEAKMIQKHFQKFPASLKEPDEHGYFPLHHVVAFLKGDYALQVVTKLVKGFPEGAQHQARDGYLPLHCAVESGTHAVSMLLLAEYPGGAQLKNADGELPLHCAAKNGKSDSSLVKALLSHDGESAMQTNKDGKLPLHLAAAEQTGERGIATVGAILKVNPLAAQQKDKAGRLPLHYAARYQSGDYGAAIITAILMAHPSAAEEKDGDGCLPLHLAACGQIGQHARANVSTILKAYPAGAEEQAGNGYLPLHYAASQLSRHCAASRPGKHSLAIVKLLVTAYPQGTQQQSSNQKLPLDVARHDCDQPYEPCFSILRVAVEDQAPLSPESVASGILSVSNISSTASGNGSFTEYVEDLPHWCHELCNMLDRAVIEVAICTADALVRDGKLSASEHPGAAAIVLLLQNPPVASISSGEVALQSLLASLDHPLYAYQSHLLAALERIEITEHPTLFHTAAEHQTEFMRHQRVSFPGLIVCSTKSQQTTEEGGKTSFLIIKNVQGRDVSSYGKPGESAVVPLQNFSAVATDIWSLTPRETDKATWLDGLAADPERLNMYRASCLVMDVGAMALRKLFLKAFKGKHGVPWNRSFGKVYVNGGYYGIPVHGEELPGTLEFGTPRKFKSTLDIGVADGDRFVVGTDAHTACHLVEVKQYRWRDACGQYPGQGVGNIADVIPRSLQQGPLSAFYPGNAYQQPARLRDGKLFHSFEKKILEEGNAEDWDCTVLNKALTGLSISVLDVEQDFPYDDADQVQARREAKTLKPGDAVRYFTQWGRNQTQHCRGYGMSSSRFDSILAAFDLLLDVALANDTDVRRERDKVVKMTQLPVEEEFAAQMARLQMTLFKEATFVTLQSLPPDVSNLTCAVELLGAIQLQQPSVLGNEQACRDLRETISETALAAVAKQQASTHLTLVAVASDVCNKAHQDMGAIVSCMSVAAESNSRMALESLMGITLQVANQREALLAKYYETCHGEDTRLDGAKKLLQAAFYALRLPPLAKGDPKDPTLCALLTYLDQPLFLGGLNKVREMLVGCRGLVEPRSSVAVAENTTTAMNKHLPRVFQTPRLSEAARKDVAIFWQEWCGFEEDEGDSRKLLDALDSKAEWENCQYDEASIEKLRLFFNCNSAHTSPTVSAVKLLKFLGRHDSVWTALKAFVGSGMRHASRPLKQLRELLDPLVVSSDLLTLKAAYLDGTRAWVFEAVEQWTRLPPDHTDYRCFWLQGTGGMGKSVIAAQLIRRHVERQGPKPVLVHFFCKHNNPSWSDPHRAVATLAYRLAQWIPAMMEKLLKSLQDTDFQAYANGSKGDLGQVFEYLLAKPLREALEAQGNSEIFLLIDALDEVVAGASRGSFLDLVGQKLTLLPCVRLIVTSRPDGDTIAALRGFKPYVLAKEDERLRSDAADYVQREIMGKTTLKNLSREEQNKVKALIVNGCENVMLAAKCAGNALKTADAKGPLTMAEVRSVMGSGNTVISDEYNKTLQRIEKRLLMAAQGDDAQLNLLRAALQRLLQVLVVVREPMSAHAVAELADVETNLSGDLLRALSLLYAAPAPGVKLEPIHKTVEDFLVDSKAAGKWAVNEIQAHALLATQCWQALKRRGLLARPQRIEPEDEAVDEVVRYCIVHGHVHLTACAVSPNDAINVWRQGIIEPRVLPKRCPKTYRLSQQAATTAFGQWLLLVAHTAGRKWALVAELNRLRDTLRRVVSSNDAFARLITETAPLYASEWAPEKSLSRAVARFASDGPSTEIFTSSAGSNCLHNAVGVLQQSLRVPLVLSSDPSMSKLKGHGAYVICVAFSPDGTEVVSGSADRTLRVWDAATGQTLRVLSGHTDGVFAVAFNHDGTEVVSGSSDSTAQVWCASSGNPLHTVHGNTGPVNAVAFNQDSTRIVVGGSSLRIWSVCGEAELLFTLMENSFPIENHLGDLNEQFMTHDIRSAAFSHDGTQVVSACKSGNKHSVSIWDATVGRLLRSLDGHSGMVVSAAFNFDGTRVVTGAYDHTARVWDAQTGAVVLEKKFDCWVRSVAFSDSDSGRSVVSKVRNTRNAVTYVWDTKTGETLRKYDFLARVGDSAKKPAGAPSHQQVAFNRDGTRVVIGGDEEVVHLWDITKSLVTPDIKVKPCTTTSTTTKSIKAVSFSPDGAQFASAGCLGVWDAATGEPLWSFGSRHVTSATFCSSAKWIASVTLDPNYFGEPDVTMELIKRCRAVVVEFWDAATGEKLKSHTFPRLGNGDCSVAFDRNGKLLVASGLSDNETISVWDMTSEPKQLCAFEGHQGFFKSLAFNYDATRVVSGGKDKTVRVWNVATGQVELAFEGHTHIVMSVAFNHNGTRVVSSSRDKTLRVWDVAVGGEAILVLNHEKIVFSVAFNHDGRRIVSGSADKTMRVWDSATGQQLHTLWHAGPVFSVAFSPAGTRVVSCGSSGDDDAMRVWDISTCDTDSSDEPSP